MLAHPPAAVAAGLPPPQLRGRQARLEQHQPGAARHRRPQCWGPRRHPEVAAGGAQQARVQRSSSQQATGQGLGWGGQGIIDPDSHRLLRRRGRCMRRPGRGSRTVAPASCLPLPHLHNVGLTTDGCRKQGSQPLWGGHVGVCTPCKLKGPHSMTAHGRARGLPGSGVQREGGLVCGSSSWCVGLLLGCEARQNALPIGQSTG